MKGFLISLLVLLRVPWGGGTSSLEPAGAPVIPVSDSSKYPQNYFKPPLNLPLTLAGNFGEPRKGHFHTGLDLHTNGEEGHVVLAAADGYVSRINVSSTGYGNALFITHPNGYVTAYGHLREFVPKLMERLRREQYAKKQFAVDIFLKPGEFPVKQGDTIALSGSTGASGGPHLHFEVRDAEERPINPLLFGFKIADEKHTVVKAVKIYAMDSLKFRCEGTRVKLLGKDSVYNAAGGIIKVNASRVGISVNAYDLMNLTENYVGVYNIKLYHEGRLVYEYKMDRIAFSDSRYVLSQLDYPEFLQDGFKVFHKCFVEPGNRCPVYSNLVNRGVIDISDGKVHDVKIEVSDFAGNTTVIRLRLLDDEAARAFKPVELKYVKVFYYQRENDFAFPGVKIKIPAYGLFDTVYFHYTASLATDPAIFSKVHQVGNNQTQVFKWFDLALKTERLSPRLRDKALIVYKDYDGTEVARGGKYDSGFIAGKVREFGTYYIKIDTTPPTIAVVNFIPGKSLKPGQKIIFKIADNLSGIGGFDTYLDGNWVETDYDAKSYSLIHTIDKNITPGEHIFKVVVRDERNNAAEYSAAFRI